MARRVIRIFSMRRIAREGRSCSALLVLTVIALRVSAGQAHSGPVTAADPVAGRAAG